MRTLTVHVPVTVLCVLFSQGRQPQICKECGITALQITLNEYIYLLLPLSPSPPLPLSPAPSLTAPANEGSMASSAGVHVAPPTAGVAPSDHCQVQFMWQPLTQMSYSKVTLLTSFKVNEVLQCCTHTRASLQVASFLEPESHRPLHCRSSRLRGLRGIAFRT